MNDYRFGNYLYDLRKRAGYTQEQVGMLVGVSPKAVSKWENGRSKPTVNALRKLESAEVIESRSSGMKGTYIRILNELILDEIEKAGEV